MCVCVCCFVVYFLRVFIHLHMRDTLKYGKGVQRAPLLYIYTKQPPTECLRCIYLILGNIIVRILMHNTYQKEISQDISQQDTFAFYTHTHIRRYNVYDIYIVSVVDILRIDFQFGTRTLCIFFLFEFEFYMLEVSARIYYLWLVFALYRYHIHILLNVCARAHVFNNFIYFLKLYIDKQVYIMYIAIYR